MREDHRIDEADLVGNPHSQQSRDASQHIRAEKDRADNARLYPKFDEEPVGDQRLNDKAACERVDGK